MSAHFVYEGLVGILAVLLILSGVDDLVPALLCAWDRLRQRKEDGTKSRSRKTERRIAIFVPCWREAKVIGDMVRHNVAAINWGLVAGKTQTFLPWDSWKRPYVDREPAVWFHEVFRRNGEPYRQEEVDLLKTLTGRARVKAATSGK